MELKKSKDANLESKKVAFASLGLIVAGAMVLMAFSYQTVFKEKIDKEIEKEIVQRDDLQEEFFQNEPPPPEQPQQTPPPVITEVEEVDDDIEIDETPVIDDDVIDLDFTPDPTPVFKKKEIFDVVDINPEFTGGDAAMALFIQKTFEYPEIAREMGEQGTVYVEFVVNKDGSIESVKVVKGVSRSIDKEAIRVVKKMPKWKPGEQQGKAVNVRYTIPIRARLG